MSKQSIKKLNEQVEALHKDHAKANKLLQEAKAERNKSLEELQKCKKFEGKITDPKLQKKLNDEIKKLTKRIKEADAEIDKQQDEIERIKKQVETCDIQIKTINKQLNAMSIDYVLGNKELLTKFKAYAKKLRFDNELEFVIAVMNRDNPLTIYKDYISEKGRHQVNISGTLRAPLDALAEAQNYKAMNFSKCASHVMSTIWMDRRSGFISTLEEN